MSQLQLKVKNIELLTRNIKRFEFVADSGKALPAFTAGAHLDFQLKDDLVRSYSLANDPSETHHYVTAVLREESGGGGSKFMHDQVSVGDIILASNPINNFNLVEHAAEHILLGGGIGITPLLAMGYKLQTDGRDFRLHYCTKSRDETAFYDEVNEVFGGKVNFYHDGGNPALGIDLVNEFSVQPEDSHVYICGPAGLLNAAKEATKSWTPGCVHFELFQSAKSGEENEDGSNQSQDQPFEVELAQSGKTLTIPADKSILQVLWENDIEVLHACEEGWCGNCVVDYLGGGVDHRDEVLDELEQETKLQVCVSRALPGDKIVLDL